MENFKTQSFTIATFESIGISVGSIFGANVALNHLAANAEMGPALLSGAMAGAPIGFALAKGVPLLTGSIAAMMDHKNISPDIMSPKIYNDGTSWKAGTIAGLALGLAMTWNMSANPITAHNLMDHLPWNATQTLILEASTTPTFGELKPA